MKVKKYRKINYLSEEVAANPPLPIHFLTFGGKTNTHAIGNNRQWSWATALAKICTDNKQSINWCVREEIVNHIQQRHHNPGYLSSVYFDTPTW